MLQRVLISFFTANTNLKMHKANVFKILFSRNLMKNFRLALVGYQVCICNPWSYWILIGFFGGIKMASIGALKNSLSSALLSLVRNSTPSLVKTEKKENETPPQKCSPSSPMDEAKMEKPKLEETARAYKTITTRYSKRHPLLLIFSIQDKRLAR